MLTIGGVAGVVGRLCVLRVNEPLLTSQVAKPSQLTRGRPSVRAHLNSIAEVFRICGQSRVFRVTLTKVHSRSV